MPVESATLATLMENSRWNTGTWMGKVRSVKHGNNNQISQATVTDKARCNSLTVKTELSQIIYPLQSHFAFNSSDRTLFRCNHLWVQYIALFELRHMNNCMFVLDYRSEVPIAEKH